jgi:hypothetical protein
MREDIGHFKRKMSEGSSIQFHEELFPDRDLPGHEEFLKRSHLFQNGDIARVNKPYVCPRLAKRLSVLFGGRQHHLCMTLVDIDLHTDRRDDGYLSTVLLIPLQASHLHFLQVEDERRQLLPNRIYAFNHYRLHALVYDSDHGASANSKPCSFIKVRFERLAEPSRPTNKRG